MVTVLFEVILKEGKKDEYLKRASVLKDELSKFSGLISIERFQSLNAPNKLLSKSVWQSEEDIKAWRNLAQHRIFQAEGRESIFEDYSITVLTPTRHYTMNLRDEAPKDSNKYFKI